MNTPRKVLTRWGFLPSALAETCSCPDRHPLSEFLDREANQLSQCYAPDSQVRTLLHLSRILLDFEALEKKPLKELLWFDRLSRLFLIGIEVKHPVHENLSSLEEEMVTKALRYRRLELEEFAAPLLLSGAASQTVFVSFGSSLTPDPLKRLLSAMGMERGPELFEVPLRAYAKSFDLSGTRLGLDDWGYRLKQHVLRLDTDDDEVVSTVKVLSREMNLEEAFLASRALRE